MMAANDELHDLAPGYALGTLDDGDRRAFEEHFEQCERCREDVAELADTAAALAYAAEGPAPPPALRGRILDAARAEKGKVVPLRRRWSPPLVVAAAAAACLAIGLGIWATVGTDSPTYRAASVAVQDESGMVGTLDVSSSGDAQLTLQRLDPPPAGKGYEIWVIERSKSPLDAGFFRHGGVNVQVKLESKVRPGAMVAVTVESSRVAAPTSKPILSASIPV